MLKKKKYVVNIWKECENIQATHNLYITKSWLEARVCCQFIFPSSWTIFSSSSCHKTLKIFPFQACNPVYFQTKMNAHKTFDTKVINMNVLCTSIWGCVSSINISRNFELQRNKVQIQSKHLLHYFLKHSLF